MATIKMHKGPDPACYGCGHPEHWQAGHYCSSCKQKPYDPSKPGTFGGGWLQ